MSTSPSSTSPLLHASRPAPPPRSTYTTIRQRIKSFLSSRAQHYTVLSLVTLDVLGIFADIIINLYECDQKTVDPRWDEARDALGLLGLGCSCLFMLELLLSIWAFGWGYFNSRFHTFDALVILASFLTDVVLHGLLEEVASLVVVLRLWRLFKIVEEFSVGAEEQMEGLQIRIEQLEAENGGLREELLRLKRGRDEEEEGGGF